MRRLRIQKEYRNLFKIAGYTLLLFLLQTYLVARLPYRALRVDLLLPVMVGVALKLSPVMSLVWAFICGYMVDVLTGKFWGLHIGTYVITVRLVQLTTQKVEFYNPFYQMLFVLVCILGQSALLGLILWIKSPALFMMDSFFEHLEIRSLLTMLLTPLIVSPLLRIR